MANTTTRQWGENSLTQTEEEVDSRGQTDPPPATIRQKFDAYLNAVGVHATIVIIVLCDLFIITFLLLISLHIIQTPPSGTSSGNGMLQQQTQSSAVRDAESALHVIQVIILSLFMAEIIGRVVGKGIDIIYDKWQIFDCIVVLITFVLYVAFTGAVSDRTITYSVAYIITLRLWRIGRLYYEITEPVVRKAQHIIISHRKAMRRADDICQKQQVQLEQQMCDIELLKEQVRRLQSKSSPIRNFSSPSEPAAFTLDGQAGNSTSPRYLHKSMSYTDGPCRNHVMQHQTSTTSNGSIPSGQLMNGSMGSADPHSHPGTPISCASCPGALDTNCRTLEMSTDRRSSGYDTGFTLNTDKEVIYKNGSSKSSRTENSNDSGKISKFSDSSKKVGKILRSGSSNALYMERSFMDSDRDLEVTVIHRSPSQSDITVAMYGEGLHHQDKDKLIHESRGKLNREMSYSNPGFAESLTEDELMREIQRIAKVPYQEVGSASILSKEGIPMTDL